MRTLLLKIIRLLSLRLSRAGYASLDGSALAVGLIGTWLAGMGRYWDNPQAELLQKLGFGSVLYVFALAALLWLIGLPLRIAGWRYRTIVTLTHCI